MINESNIDKILRGKTSGFESWYIKYVQQNAEMLRKKQKQERVFGTPGQRTSQQIQAEIEHLRAKDTATSNRIRSTYYISK